MARVLSGFILLLVFAVPVAGDTREEHAAQRAKKEAQQAERERANTVLFAQVLCVAGGGLLVWVAVGLARRGLGVGPRRMTGLPAWVVAGVLGTIGLAVAIGGVLYMPELLTKPNAELPLIPGRVVR